MKRLPVVRHLSAERAEAEYRACKHPIEKLRWHAIGLLLRTDPVRTPAQVGDLVGLSVITTRDVLKRWNEHGHDGLADGRKSNGSESKLDEDQRTRLLAARKTRPPDGGLWSGPKVARYVRTTWGIEIAPQTGWKWLVDLGFTLPVPRPSHPKGGRPAVPEALGKNVRERLRRLRKAHPKKVVEVWAQDEARLGLKPITRRVWVLKCRRPRSCGRTRYQWVYLYGFARPKTGGTFGVLLPRVKAERMSEALAAFAAHADPAGRKVLVVLVDNAGWHRAKALVVPGNVILHFLPPCTPELQPAEALWPLVREAVANRSLGRIDRLKAIVRDRVEYLKSHPDKVQPRVGFHWAVGLER